MSTLSGAKGCSGAVALHFAGSDFELLPGRAMFWRKHSLLLLSDLHLGKDDHFRRAGLAVPSGSTERDLQRITALLRDTGAQQLGILGDLLHAAVPAQPPIWLRQWEQWRQQHAQCLIWVVPGNHDRSLAQSDLGIEVRPDPHVVDGIGLRHAPAETAPSICGHLHPVVRLPGLPGVWPALLQRHGNLILPAFGAFTGGMRVAANGKEPLWLCIHDQVLALRGTG